MHIVWATVSFARRDIPRQWWCIRKDRQNWREATRRHLWSKSSANWLLMTYGVTLFLSRLVKELYYNKSFHADTLRGVW